jgi:hypothetical protein
VNERVNERMLFIYLFLLCLHFWHLDLRLLSFLNRREYESSLSALIQQRRIANMNANDPAMTKISPINAGIVICTGMGMDIGDILVNDGVRITT